MARAHMLYDDKKLDNLKQYSGTWPTQLDAKALGSSGPGMLLEAWVQSRCRMQLSDGGGEKHRFIIVSCKLVSGYERQFTDKGTEVEVATGKTSKQSTGYLNSSYATKSGKTDKLTTAQVEERLQRNGLHKLLSVCGVAQTAPASSSGATVHVWGTETLLQSMELSAGTLVRIKTAGDSPLVETLVVVDNERTKTAVNYAGDVKAGETWTDKLMDKGKAKNEEASVGGTGSAGADGEGADDDEWDD